jgi:hypothetical protein
MKGESGVLDDVKIDVALRSSFTPRRVELRDCDGTTFEALDDARGSVATHTFDTPWTRIQLAYFVGTAMWTYLIRCSYADFGIPALLAGIAASHYGLRHTAVVYAAAVVALAAGALVSLIAGRRRDSGRRVAATERAVPSPPGPCTIPPCLPAEPVERAPEAVSS